MMAEAIYKIDRAYSQVIQKLCIASAMHRGITDDLEEDMKSQEKMERPHAESPTHRFSLDA